MLMHDGKEGATAAPQRTKSICGAGRSWPGRTTESLLLFRKHPWVESDLLLAIREVDEVIHLQEELWFGSGGA